MASPDTKRSKPVVLKPLKGHSFTSAMDLKQYHFFPEVYDFWRKRVEGKLITVLTFDVNKEGIERFSGDVVRMAKILGYGAEDFDADRIMIYVL